MRTGIHPDQKYTQVTCTCGNKFEILTVHEELSVDICSACHPFYTGTQKFVDSAGRVDAFTKRFQWSEDDLKKKAGQKQKNVPKATKRLQKDLKLELEKKKVFGKKKVIPELEGKGDKRK